MYGQPRGDLQGTAVAVQPSFHQHRHASQPVPRPRLRCWRTHAFRLRPHAVAILRWPWRRRSWARLAQKGGAVAQIFTAIKVAEAGASGSTTFVAIIVSRAWMSGRREGVVRWADGAMEIG